MPKYTFQAGAHFPNSLIDLTNYKDADNTVGPIIAQIKAYQESGDYDAAQQLITQHASTLKKYCFDSAAINKYVEELRNLEIYSKAHKQQIFYVPAEDEASIYADLQDVWIGSVGDPTSVIEMGDALEFQVLDGATYVGQDGKLHTGTMPNYGSVVTTIDPGESYPIPMGYHDGGGLITARTTAAQGGTGDLGTFEKNGRKGTSEHPIPVDGYSAVTFYVNVPTVMEGQINTVAKQTITISDLQHPINQFLIITGMSSTKSTKKETLLYWIKKSTGTDWTKKDGGTNGGIQNISGNSFSIKWSAETTFNYWAW